MLRRVYANTAQRCPLGISPTGAGSCELRVDRAHHGGIRKGRHLGTGEGEQFMRVQPMHHYGITIDEQRRSSNLTLDSVLKRTMIAIGQSEPCRMELSCW